MGDTDDNKDILDSFLTGCRDKITAYAHAAIEALEEQLKNARTQNKVLKLQSRIEGWKTSIKLLEKNDA